ncbi:hypothetical protein ACOME3_003908 [Neoechinorhynchus agilis]
MADSPDYKCDYAKSGRAGCKHCKTTITKGALRIAKMVQSHIFDGVTPNWYHMKCFFEIKGRMPISGDEIDGICDLRWEDQESIRALVSKVSGNGCAPKKVVTLCNNVDVLDEIKQLTQSDYKTDYAKTARSKCRGCEMKIDKGALRISRNEAGERHVKIDKWYHPQCFSVDFDGCAETFDGFARLNTLDQIILIDKFGSGLSEKSKEILLKPPEKELKVSTEVKKVDDGFIQQNKEIWNLKDKIGKVVSQAAIKDILFSNEQFVPTGEAALLEALVDRIMFGCLPKCPECSGLLTNDPYGYKCTGNLTEWTKCMYITTEPVGKRMKIKLDDEEIVKVVGKYKHKTKRIFVERPKSTIQPLRGMKFVMGRLNIYKPADAKALIERVGGKVLTKVSERTTGVISAEKGKEIDAEKLGVPVISEEIITKLIEANDMAVNLSEYILSDWKDERIKRKFVEGEEKSSKMMKMTIKGGEMTAVDPDAELSDDYHVIERRTFTLVKRPPIAAVTIKDKKGKLRPMSAILNLVDIIRSCNSYYKIQILEPDDIRGSYYVFRSWGRVGTDVGGSKLDECIDRGDAINMFTNLFFEKTGNSWNTRDTFKKVPNKFYPVELDYGDVDAIEKAQKMNDTESSLEKSLQKLVRLIFDIEAMNKTLLQFEVDLSKMPLGKISKNRIRKAFEVLSELQELINGGDRSSTRVLDATTRFFTLVPHDFGLGRIPLLDDGSKIKAKSDMLSNMMEIEIAYSMLTTEGNDENLDPLKTHFMKLNCQISFLDRDNPDYKLICEYVNNTHAPTHREYKIVVDEIYSVSRKDEESRYMPFKRALPNRTLLWHGSRTTNYAGILSQGLRIAPPEAPVTGYMFGKGIYFADMVSKSANYCFASPENNTGLLLLSEVALGNIMECHAAKFIKKLPNGTHSCKKLMEFDARG